MARVGVSFVEFNVPKFVPQYYLRYDGLLYRVITALECNQTISIHKPYSCCSDTYLNKNLAKRIEKLFSREVELKKIIEFGHHERVTWMYYASYYVYDKYNHSLNCLSRTVFRVEYFFTGRDKKLHSSDVT